MSLENSTGNSPLRGAWVSLIRSRFETPSVYPEAKLGARIAALDEELRLMEDPEIHALAKRLRNATVAACRLPAELLSIIFAFVKTIWQPTESLDDCHYDSRWIQITHVCFNWRSIALTTPTLWATFDVYQIPPQFIPLFLERSQLLNLDFAYNMASLGYIDLLEQGLNDLENWLSEPVLRRVGSLTIYCTNFAEWDLVRKLATHSPLLENLRLELDHEIPELQSTESRKLILPESFLIADSQVPPALTRMSLQNILPNWNYPLLSNLTHLSLTFSSDVLCDFDQIPTLRQFLHVLARMASLRSLHLNDFFPSYAQSESEVRLRLPACFERIELGVSRVYDDDDDVAMDCLFLYNCLTIPQTAQQILYFGPTKFPLNAVDRAVPADTVSRLFSVHECEHGNTRMTGLEFYPFHIDAQYATTSSIGGAQVIVSTRQLSTTPHAYTLYTRIPEAVYDTPLFTSGISSALAEVESISFYYEPNIFGVLSSLPTWLRIELLTTLKSAINTSFIYLSYSFSYHMLLLLVEKDADGGALSFWPGLRTVGFKHNYIPSLFTLGTREVDQLKLSEALVNMLRIRRDAGAPIERLQVAEDLRTKDIWAAVRDLVEVEYV